MRKYCRRKEGRSPAFIVSFLALGNNKEQKDPKLSAFMELTFLGWTQTRNEYIRVKQSMSDGDKS